MMASKIATLLLLAAVAAKEFEFEALSRDDECGDVSSECALNAIQLKSIQTEDASAAAEAFNGLEGLRAADFYMEEPEGTGIVRKDLPPDFDNTTIPDPGPSPHSGPVAPKVSSDDLSTQYDHCVMDPNNRRCALYRLCRGKHICLLGYHGSPPYMVIPGEPVLGMESINGKNAKSFDELMTVARDHCDTTKCVIITNPVHHRTQDQLHIHFRHYDRHGAHLHQRLEKALCGTQGWQTFHQCGRAKARIFDTYPGVFSEVADAFGGGSLANVGITVWFTDACGGEKKTMILATTFCSIEHDISAR
eukprot:TRINITY_DN14552_c0_g3_i2.p1 TRINITY_DN14552_c0_g3~~TRINITY_DN14552_c0_g3_i2.p1  ORF type:complete len:305 (+),score=52.38 TRINITY_DN14552_c0_g3_i2:80-994(+)